MGKTRLVPRVLTMDVYSFRDRSMRRGQTQEWRTTKRYGAPGYGAPTPANIRKFAERFEASTRPGGVNAHIGEQQVVRARVVDQRSGEVLGAWERPMFEVIGTHGGGAKTSRRRGGGGSDMVPSLPFYATNTWGRPGGGGGGAKHGANAKPYVGRVRGGPMQVFWPTESPTEGTHGHRFVYSIGPFRTLRGAMFMAEHGEGNPHCVTVAEAEHLALKKARGLLR